MKLLRRYLYKIIFNNLLLVFIVCTWLGFLMAVGVHAATHERSHLSFHSPQIIATKPDTQLQNGQRLYQAGQYLEAANVWKSSASNFESQGDILNQGLVLSYLALAYQQLGQFQEAETTMNQAVALLTHQTLPQSQFILAQSLNNQGQLQFNQGKSDIALETWKQAEKLYRELGDSTGEIGTQLNQARALQALGFYRRAKTTLEQVEASLTRQSDSQLKLAGLLNLGNVLRVTGDLAASKTVLEQGLAVAQQLQSVGDIQVAQLSLGNLAEVQEQPQNALNYYQQAATENSPVRLQAQIHQLNLLVKLNRLQEAQTLLPLIQSQLANLPPSKTTIYAQLVKTGDKAGAIASYTEAVNTLQSLRQDLVSINQDVQFSFQEQVEPVYRELVDLLLQSNQSPPLPRGAGGVSPYQEAGGVSSTARETEAVSQANLQRARETIEALQLAELANFFREACLDTQPQSIDRIDPTAAVIYPIILPDRLEVILSLPKQNLRNYTINLSQEQVEAGINRMRQSFRRTSFAEERLSAAQEIYRWLVQPAVEDLTQESIKTLVFVLDGSLRNLPMAALHDGKQYLIEQYRIAIAPSLQLLAPQRLARSQSKALLGGLSEGKQEFSALPGVKEEVKEIDATVPATVLLNQEFTRQALQTQIRTQPYSIVHLATHGQFSSKPEETFVLTWDGRLDVKQLNELLTNRELSNSPPLDLLVLSACQTAKGDKRAALGLAGVAVRSGARSTLATLWTVSDESTANFMEQFYKELLTPNITKAEAVRLAQLHLLQEPESSHPFFWAPFILVGNWL
jgi:CHAT domain-containing protein